MEKKGGWKYNFLITLIIVLLVLAFAVYFVVKGEFTPRDVNWKTCKESITLRTRFPDEFKITPLKCKSEVVIIDFENVTKAEQMIADKIVQSWNLVDAGDAEIYPGGFGTPESYCIFPVRFTIDDTVKQYYEQNQIDFLRILELEVEAGGARLPLWQYAKVPGKEWSDTFKASSQGLSLRRYFDPSENLYIVVSSNPGVADLRLLFGVITLSEGTGNLGSILLWVQSKHGELDKALAEHWSGAQIKLCKHVEGYVT